MLMSPSSPARRKPRSLALDLVEALEERIRDGRLSVGDKLPTESEVMAEFGVSRTVVREAISRLQAAGLVETRHGVGTFVLDAAGADNFRIAPEQMATIVDVIAVLELRIGLEAEAAALAATRRSAADLRALREAQSAFARAVDEGSDAISSDVQLHMEIARATQNPHYAELMGYLGTLLIPRARVDTARFAGKGGREYLARVLAEHDSIVAAIANRDADAARAAMRTHLSNSRERLRRAQEAAQRSN
ncbi:MAG TPA: FadR/GntR family transcriptional regulator [Burkholderiaceae bacterium]|nr:FadR/GntR family transcriptional regulator [Burkholderiaceae bacterium]